MVRTEGRQERGGLRLVKMLVNLYRKITRKKILRYS